MSNRIDVAEAFLNHWRGMFGQEGLLAVNATRDPTDAELEALAEAVAPFTTEPTTSLVLVANKVPTFRTPQRSYQKIDVGTMLEDPANHPEYADVHTPGSLAAIGAWRWKITQKHKDTILPLIRGKRTIDFGGLAGPVGYGSIIVDHGSDEYRAIYDVPGQVDTIFASHTLEHVRDARGLLACMWDKLKGGGHLILVVPSWQFEFLRAENYPHHYHTFYRGCDGLDWQTREKWSCLDEMVGATPVMEEESAQILVSDDDGESILLIARVCL